MPTTPKFPIYEFSKKFDNIQCKNGIWVSGSYVLDKEKAFDRLNHNGNINDIPDKIRQAVIEGLFEIPDAYPTNSLNDEEFTNLVETRELDIAHPPLDNRALIARDLDGYCVLAVATRQIDNMGRAKLIGYRFFWLKISDLPSQSIYLVDGIATLLEWWHEVGMPCFAMNPHSYKNENIDYFSQKVTYKYQTIQSYEPKGEVLESKSNPYLFQETIDGSLNCRELHAQAVHQSNKYTQTAWAWNVRKLKKPKTFTVVYCADRESYEQFSSEVLKPTAPPPPKSSIVVTSNSQDQHKADSSFTSYLTVQPVSESPSPRKPQDNLNFLKKHLGDVAKNTKSQFLPRLITFYKEKPPCNFNFWFHFMDQEVLDNLPQQRREFNIHFMVLVSVFIWDILSDEDRKGIKGTFNLSDNEKTWAGEYLDDFLGSVSDYQTSNEQYEQSISQLIENMALLRKELLDEDSAKGNELKNSPTSRFKIPQFMNLGFGQKQGLSRTPRHLKDNSKNNNQGNKSSFWVDLRKPWDSLFNQPLVIGGLLGLAIILVGLAITIYSCCLPPINSLIPMSKIADLASSLKKKYGSDANPQYTVKQLETARKFIVQNLLVTKKCGDGGSLAEPKQCKIYKETKNQLPGWPELPDTLGSTANTGLAKGENNPPQFVEFLQDSFKVLEKRPVGNLREFDEKLETTVKNFQKEECEQPNNGQVGEKTWQCLSDYVQKEQVIAVLDYWIESLEEGKTDSEIEEGIKKCIDENKEENKLKPQDFIVKPQDFIKCVKPTGDNENE